jgi:hypothetical protein
MTFILRATARSFIPGISGHYLSTNVKRKVSWDPKGTTCVKRFMISDYDALPKKELMHIPFSEIKTANPKEANLFKNPEITNIEYDNLNKELETILNEKFEKTCERFEIIKKNYYEEKKHEKMVDSLLNEESNTVNWNYTNKQLDKELNELPIFTYTKREMRMWCE